MKLLKTGLVVLVACTMLAGCSKKNLSEDEMKTLFQEGQTKMAQVESGKLGIEANLTMSGQALKELGMDQTEMAVNLDMTYKDLKKESVGISADFGLSVTGMDLKGSLYVKDSDMYVSVLGNKIKMPLEQSTIEMMETPMNMDLGVYTNWSYENKDGIDYISFDVDPASYESIINNLQADEEMTFKANKLHMTYGFNQDKYMTGIYIEVAVDMVSGEEKVAYQGTIDMTWQDHNNIQEISYPDFNGYIEMYDLELDDL